MQSTIYRGYQTLICNKHFQPVHAISVDNGGTFDDALICEECRLQMRTIQKSVIGMKLANKYVKEKNAELNQHDREIKEMSLKYLLEYEQVLQNFQWPKLMIDTVVEIIHQWYLCILPIGESTATYNLEEELRLFYRFKFTRITSHYYLRKCNCDYFKKIELLYKLFEMEECFQSEQYQKLQEIGIERDQMERMAIDKFWNEKLLMTNLETQVSIVQEESIPLALQFGGITYELTFDNYLREEKVFALTFNSSGTILLSGCYKTIIVWKFYEGEMFEDKVLAGHPSAIISFAYSKKRQWFVSYSTESSLICWKEVTIIDTNTKASFQWIPSDAYNGNEANTGQLIMNSNEDELISSDDYLIKVWKINMESNTLEFNYTLEKKHQSNILCITMNNTESALISCDLDQQMILWVKDEKNQWIFSSCLKIKGVGHRISFCSDHQIIWQAQDKPTIKGFEIINQQIIRRPELTIRLEMSPISEKYRYFPLIFFPNQRILFWNHSDYLYTLGKQYFGGFQMIGQPINFEKSQVCGTLSENGQFLVIWRPEDQGYKVLQIFYN